MLAGIHSAPVVAKIAPARAAIAALHVIGGGAAGIGPRLVRAVDFDGEEIDVRRQAVGEAGYNRINVALVEGDVLAVRAGEGDRKRLRRGRRGARADDLPGMVCERRGSDLFEADFYGGRSVARHREISEAK